MKIEATIFIVLCICFFAPEKKFKTERYVMKLGHNIALSTYQKTPYVITEQPARFYQVGFVPVKN